MTEGRVVYDWESKTQVTRGETGEERTTLQSTRGEWPSCLQADLMYGLKDPNPSNFEKRSCQCGRHILYWVRIPANVWPNNHLERMRVLEREAEPEDN